MVLGALGELLEAFGPLNAPKLKKTRKSEFVDPPQGARRAAKIVPKSHLEAFFVLKSMSRIDL